MLPNDPPLIRLPPPPPDIYYCWSGLIAPRSLPETAMVWLIFCWLFCVAYSDFLAYNPVPMPAPLPREIGAKGPGFGLILRIFMTLGFEPFLFYWLNLYGCTFDNLADSVSVCMPEPYPCESCFVTFTLPMALPCKLLSPPSEEPPKLWSLCLGSWTGFKIFGFFNYTLAAVLWCGFTMKGFTSTFSKLCA